MPRGMIVGIAGGTAGGKTTVAKHIAETHGAYRTKYSDVLINIAKNSRPQIALDKQSLQELSTHLRTTHGEDYLTLELKKKLLYVRQRIVVIEGNRRMVDINFLQSLAEEEGKELVLLYIDADPASRWSRMNRRLQEEGKPSVLRAQFDAMEHDECEAELPLVREYIIKHGTVIDNTTLSLDGLLLKVEQIITESARP